MHTNDGRGSTGEIMSTMSRSFPYMHYIDLQVLEIQTYCCIIRDGAEKRLQSSAAPVSPNRHNGVRLLPPKLSKLSQAWPWNTERREASLESCTVDQRPGRKLWFVHCFALGWFGLCTLQLRLGGVELVLVIYNDALGLIYLDNPTSRAWDGVGVDRFGLQ